MLRLFGLLIGLGWVFVGWRNMPRMSETSALTAGVAIGITCWISYLVGRSATRAEATAIAMARAAARAKASASAQSAAVGNVFVLNGGGGPGSPGGEGARVVAARELGGLDGAEWIGGAKPEIDADSAESILEDLAEDYSYDREGG